MAKIFGVHAKLGNTDKQAYTPTLNSNTAVSVNSAFFKQNGDELEITAYVSYNGVGAGTTFTLGLPATYSVNPSKISIANSEQILGHAQYFDQGIAHRVGSVIYNSANFVSIVLDSAGGGVSSANSAGDSFCLIFKVPVVGKSSSDILPITP